MVIHGAQIGAHVVSYVARKMKQSPVFTVQDVEAWLLEQGVPATSVSRTGVTQPVANMMAQRLNGLYRRLSPSDFEATGLANMPMNRLFEALRSTHKLSQKSQIAKQLGITTASLTHWESRGISRAGYVTIERAFNISAHWLLTGTGRMLATPNGEGSSTNPIALPSIHQRQWDGFLAAATREFGASALSQDGNAPGHAHRIPGYWDQHNGVLAGQPCALCMAWRLALREVGLGGTDQGPGLEVVFRS